VIAIGTIDRGLMCQPLALRLRGTFIDFRPDQSEIESVVGHGSRVRSFSSPPGVSMPEEAAESFEHCSNQYLKGLVSRVMKLSDSIQSSSKGAMHHPEDNASASKLSTSKGRPQRRQEAAGAPGQGAAVMPSEVKAALGDHATQEPEVVTTLMIRNIPCKITLKALIDLIDSYGFAGTYDFLHLPGRGRPFSNLGYAFLNFSETDMVEKFVSKFHDVAFSTISGINTEKVIEIRPARAQGFAQNIAKVRHIMSSSNDDSLFVITNGASYML